MDKRKLWFVKRDGEVKGPFPGKVISQYFLLGRLRDTDEVSEGGSVWHPLFEVDELIPEVMKLNPTDPETRHRLAAALRGADERLTGERRVEGDSDERRSGDRRVPEGVEAVAGRRRRLASLGARASGKQPVNGVIGGVVLAVIVVSLGALMLYSPTSEERGIDCGAAPMPGVNWSNCRMAGAQLKGVDISGAVLRNTELSGADMSGAILSGIDLAYGNASLANFGQSDLRNAVLTGVNFHRSVLLGADLRGADLAYADLRGADLTSANLTGARLDRAIWINGVTCARGSVGQCVAEP